MYYKYCVKKVIEHCKISYKLIPTSKFTIGPAFFYRKCHLMSVQHAVLHDSEVYLCVYVNNNEPVIHFINKLKTGKYQDTTLGWIYKFNDYYIIRKIEIDEYDKIGDILVEYQQSFLRRFSNIILRKIFNVQYLG